MTPAPWWHTALILAGWLFAAAGIVILLWALFGDRSRGRKRCPRCWYDMSGAAPAPGDGGPPRFTCPECGRGIIGEQQLRRSRRRWRWAIVAALLLPGAWVAACVPAMRTSGWWAFAPRPLLIVLVLKLDSVPRRASTGVPDHLLETEHRVLGYVDRRVRLFWPEKWLAQWSALRALRGQGSNDLKTIAARMLVLNHRDPVRAVEAEHRGPVVLARATLAYQELHTYRDRGVVASQDGSRGPILFVTAFVRSTGAFRFEFLFGYPKDVRLTTRHVTWSTAGQIQSWSTMSPMVRPSATLLNAITLSNAYSGGSAGRVPLHFATVSRAKWPSPLDQGAHYITTEPIDGHPCHRVDYSNYVWDESVWIDASTFMIRRIENRGQFPSTITYQPEVNVPLEPSLFEFDPAYPERSPLQDE